MFMRAHRAMGDGRIYDFKSLIKKCADLNLCCSGKTLLYGAVQKAYRSKYKPYRESDRWQYVKLLLKSGATPQLERGFTSMHLGITYNELEVVMLFLQYGHKLEDTDLMLAVTLSAENLCITLLDWGAFVSSSQTEDSDSEPSLFYKAANYHLLGLMRLMIYRNPQYLQEDWVVKKELPKCMTTRKTQMEQFWSWMQEQRKQPADLQHLCMARVIKQLSSKVNVQQVQKKGMEVKPLSYHPHLPTVINELPVPKMLKRLLQVPDLQEAMEDADIIDYTL